MALLPTWASSDRRCSSFIQQLVDATSPRVSAACVDRGQPDNAPDLHRARLNGGALGGQVRHYGCRKIR